MYNHITHIGVTDIGVVDFKTNRHLKTKFYYWFLEFKIKLKKYLFSLRKLKSSLENYKAIHHS